MFRIILPGSKYADLNGAPCKIIRSTHEVIHYIRNGRTCIASMDRFQNDFEPISKFEAARIEDEIERAHHIKQLRAMRVASIST